MKKERKILSFVFLAVFVSALFFISANALAAEIKIEEVKKTPIIFTPQITIPGSEIFKKGVPFTVTKETMPTMARDLYRFLVGSAGIVAVIVMMAGGYYWLFAGGNTARVGQAKDYIGGAVVGLTLALGSYMILNMINPDLVNMKNFEIPAVPKIIVITDATGQPVSLPMECPQSDKDLAMIWPSGSGLVSNAFLYGCNLAGGCKIKGLERGNVTDPRLNKNTLEALKKAAAEAYSKGYTIVLTSAHRTPDYQKQLYDCYQLKQKTGTCPDQCAKAMIMCNLASKNFCEGPHVKGIAVDVCLEQKNGFTTCGQIISSMNDSYKNNPNQLKLKAIMEKAGFRRFCKEWWHFELPGASSCLD